MVLYSRYVAARHMRHVAAGEREVVRGIGGAGYFDVFCIVINGLLIPRIYPAPLYLPRIRGM